MTRAILTCSEHFTELALNELRRYHPQLTVLNQLSPHHTFIENRGSFDDLTRPWRHKLPVYLHHLFPVHHQSALEGTLQDLPALRHIARRLIRRDATVQARITGTKLLPYDARQIEAALSRKQSRASPSAKPDGRILSVLIVSHADSICAYIGVSWANQNISTYARGVQPFSEHLPNRAGYKLLEALSAFHIPIQTGMEVLDLGAAPGAWTLIFVDHGACVTAVAPKAMYPWLMDSPQIRYFPLTAEDYRSKCDQTFDLITNDMILDAQDSARLMVDYAPLLRRDGRAIMTLKLRQHNRRKVTDHTLRILRQAYDIIHMRQLVHNQKEVTLFLRRKAEL